MFRHPIFYKINYDRVEKMIMLLIIMVNNASIYSFTDLTFVAKITCKCALKMEDVRGSGFHPSFKQERLKNSDHFNINSM